MHVAFVLRYFILFIYSLTFNFYNLLVVKKDGLQTSIVAISWSLRAMEHTRYIMFVPGEQGMEEL